MTGSQNILRRAALQRFLAEPLPATVAALAGHRPSQETVDEISADIQRFFPSAKRFRKAAMNGTTVMSDRISSIEFAAVFAAKVVPRIRKTARACRMLDFGHLPNRTFALAQPEALALPHPHDDWIGIHEWELGMTGYYVELHGPEGFEVFELQAVTNPEQRTVLIAGDHAQVRPGPNGALRVATACHPKGLSPDECVEHTTGNVVRPVLVMLAAFNDARCTRTSVKNFGQRVDAGPFIRTTLDA